MPLRIVSSTTKITKVIDKNFVVISTCF